MINFLVLFAHIHNIVFYDKIFKKFKIYTVIKNLLFNISMSCKPIIWPYTCSLWL